MKALIYTLFGILTVLILSCSESTNESRKGNSGIQGTVLDGTGNPVNNVGIHIVFNGLPLPGETISKVSQTDSVLITAIVGYQTNEGVEIHWITDYESVTVVGFNVWKSELENESYEKINTALIPGNGNSTGTHEYIYYDRNIVSSVEYWYQIEVIFTGGSSCFFGPVGVLSVATLPESYQLDQNYPNPFNPTTSICYSLAKQSQVNLKIYDRKGLLIRELVDKMQEAGRYEVRWNGKNEEDQICTDGLYTYVFKADSFQAQKVMCIHQRIPEVLEWCVPLTTTDENGSFTVDEVYLPVSEKILHTSETGDSLGVLTISESFSVVLTKAGYVSVVDTLQFVPGQLVSKSYVMTKN